MAKHGLKQPKTHTLDVDICHLLCPIAAGMVGICLTTIGLIRVVITINKVNTLADDLLSLDALLFLLTTLSSYIALRKRGERRIHWLEKTADLSFMAGMSLMVVICVFITYSIS